jgi:hypothetical protein
MLAPAGSKGQEARVNQKKIEKEKKNREKAAMKDYRDALKRHHNNQSKETRTMMKHSRKEAKKNTPVRKK